MCIYIFFFFSLTVRWTRQITVWRPLHRKRQIETTLSKSHRKNCTNQTGNSCQLGSKWILFSWQTMFLSIRLRGHEGPLQIYIFKALTLPKIQHLDVEISTKYKSITKSKTKSFKRHLEKHMIPKLSHEVSYQKSYQFAIKHKDWPLMEHLKWVMHPNVFFFFCSATLYIFPIWSSNHPVRPSITLHNLEINVFLFSGRGEIPRTPVLWTNAFMSPFRRAVWLDNKHNREGWFTASKNGPAPPSGTALTSRLSLQVSHQILKYVRKWCRAPAAWTLCVVQ